MGILNDDLVIKTQKYLNGEKEIKENPLVKEILLVFPNSKLTYHFKENKKWI